jgi:hypothetical protein
MEKIQSHAELTEIIRRREGYVLNDRTDRRMLHCATCNALEVMSTRAYDKLFFEDLDEATKWCNRKFGAHGWEVCGRCR